MTDAAIAQPEAAIRPAGLPDGRVVYFRYTIRTMADITCMKLGPS
ncbi:hypothetical protein ERY430_50105 [Erythrobacter sp. EC-HK427]|nr:hypothetical protein ERY430_50105 [Erythrobacter sp. EC-HK427]